MMNELYDLCENLKDEIKELNKKGDISPTELERAYKAVDIIKDIKTIEAMEEAGYSNAGGSYGGSYNSYEGSSRDGGQSSRMYPSYYYDEPGMSRGRAGRDGDGDGRYSEARGRDAMGRYTSRDNMSRDGYSGHQEKEQMMRQIEQMKRKVEQM